MSEEKLNLQPIPLSTEQTVTDSIEFQEVHISSYEAYRQSLDQIALSLEEVETNRTTIETAGREMIDNYDLDPTFFKEPSRVLLFTSMASRWSKSETDKDERLFLEDALALLAHKDSLKLKEIFDYATGDTPEVTDEHKQKVYDKYTNHQMTNELKVAIEAGLLDGVKARLGVTADNEDPFEVCVLSIKTGTITHGMVSEPLPEMEMEDFKDPEKSKKFKEAVETYNTVREWEKGLEKRWDAFHQEAGASTVAAPGWVVHINGKTLLCMQQGIVEKILHPEVTVNSEVYNQEDRERDVAFLEHEYVHTQGGVNLGGKSIDFGISIEELRAENFSGNKHDYRDIKAFERDMAVATGTNIVKYFEGKEKGGDSLSIYEEVAKSFGLNRMLEVIMVRPSVYDEDQSSILNRVIANYLGGFDGVLSRVIDDRVQLGQETEIDDRIDKMARRYISNSDPDFLPTYFSALRRRGNVLMTDLIEKRVQELQAKANSDAVDN